MKKSIITNYIKKIEKGKIERGVIGVSMRDMDASAKKYYGRDGGAIIMDVIDDSPAQKAGLKRGDLVVSANGKEKRRR